MSERFLITEEEIREFILNNNIKTPIELANIKLKKEFNRKESLKLKPRIEAWMDTLDSEVKYKYYELYTKYFKVPKMLNQYYTLEIFNESSVKRAIILEYGRNFSDGFSGIKVKNNSYTDDYVLEIFDGEKGQVFCKKYNDSLPTKEQIIVDSIFLLGDLKVREQGNLYSIYDFFN